MITRHNLGGTTPGPDIIASIGGRVRAYDRTATGLVEVAFDGEGFATIDLGVPRRGAQAQAEPEPRKRCLSCGRLQNEDGTLDCGH